MKGVRSTPGTMAPIPKELKGPVAITRFAALHLPTAEYWCYAAGRDAEGNKKWLYKLFGSPEKGKRGLKSTGFYDVFMLSGGTRIPINSANKTILFNQFDFVKAFTFVKFPNGDKLLRIFIRVPDTSIFKENSCLKQSDLEYFQQYPERVIYENGV